MKCIILFNDDKTVEIEYDNVLYTPSHMEFQKVTKTESPILINDIVLCVAVVPWANVKIMEPIDE